MFSIPSQQRTAPKELIQMAKAQANDILMNIRGIDYIMLCSTDGFELASVYKKNPYNSTKLAAVSSSILAMVSAFISEIDLHGCQTITLDAENGKALLTAVPHPRYPTVIVALTSKDVLLGQMLYEMKKVSADLAAYQVS